MDITITIPEEYKQQIIDGFVYHHGYEDMIIDPEDPPNLIPNPESKLAFSKRMFRGYVKRCVVNYELRGAVESARQQALIDLADLKESLEG